MGKRNSQKLGSGPNGSSVQSVACKLTKYKPCCITTLFKTLQYDMGFLYTHRFIYNFKPLIC